MTQLTRSSTISGFVPNNTTWTFEVLMAARSSAGEVAGYTINGLISNAGGTVYEPVYTANTLYTIAIKTLTKGNHDERAAQNSEKQKSSRSRGTNWPNHVAPELR